MYHTYIHTYVRTYVRTYSVVIQHMQLKFASADTHYIARQSYLYSHSNAMSKNECKEETEETKAIEEFEGLSCRTVEMGKVLHGRSLANNKELFEVLHHPSPGVNEVYSILPTHNTLLPKCKCKCKYARTHRTVTGFDPHSSTHTPMQESIAFISWASQGHSSARNSSVARKYAPCHSAAATTTTQHHLISSTITHAERTTLLL